MADCTTLSNLPCLTLSFPICKLGSITALARARGGMVRTRLAQVSVSIRSCSCARHAHVMEEFTERPRGAPAQGHAASSLPGEGPLQSPRGSSLLPSLLHFFFLTSILGLWSR